MHEIYCVFLLLEGISLHSASPLFNCVHHSCLLSQVQCLHRFYLLSPTLPSISSVIQQFLNYFCFINNTLDLLFQTVCNQASISSFGGILFLGLTHDYLPYRHGSECSITYGVFHAVCQLSQYYNPRHTFTACFFLWQQVLHLCH